MDQDPRLALCWQPVRHPMCVAMRPIGQALLSECQTLGQLMLDIQRECACNEHHSTLKASMAVELPEQLTHEARLDLGWAAYLCLLQLRLEALAVEE